MWNFHENFVTEKKFSRNSPSDKTRENAIIFCLSCEQCRLTQENVSPPHAQVCMKYTKFLVGIDVPQVQRVSLCEPASLALSCHTSYITWILLILRLLYKLQYLEVFVLEKLITAFLREFSIIVKWWTWEGIKMLSALRGALSLRNDYLFRLPLGEWAENSSWEGKHKEHAWNEGLHPIHTLTI